ncbi:Ubiquinol-cytochrome C reductase, cytochrome C1 subunit [hydrothermal vent metagenome]|uniref:Ubiquinol-cytochrome C reductase, cytochrome C1 subunit n=1 Tax=hydrothermal vent metagenome TaxID=652676 RepID=A0A3B0XVM0_9ZZZZ
MKKLILALLFIPILSIASGGGPKLDQVTIDVSNISTLQRGAKIFVNYCMGCHSLKYVSYGRLAKDLSLTENQVYKYMVGTHKEKKRLSDYMITALSKAQAKRFYGGTPPDLSTISRARGDNWLYTYLRSFYVDKSDKNLPFGVNNIVFDKVSMPHVMIKLQGEQTAQFEPYYVTNDKGEKIKKKRFVGFLPVNAEGLSQAELDKKAKAFDNTTRDLVTFLSYVGDPGKLARHAVGFWVLLFLIVFTLLAYLMKKEFWRDIH